MPSPSLLTGDVRIRAAILATALLIAPGCVTTDMRGPLDYGSLGFLLYGDSDTPAQKERNRKLLAEIRSNSWPTVPEKSTGNP